jgi:hypothetical protein
MPAGQQLIPEHEQALAPPNLFPSHVELRKWKSAPVSRVRIKLHRANNFDQFADRQNASTYATWCSAADGRLVRDTIWRTF